MAAHAPVHLAKPPSDCAAYLEDNLPWNKKAQAAIKAEAFGDSGR